MHTHERTSSLQIRKSLWVVTWGLVGVLLCGWLTGCNSAVRTNSPYVTPGEAARNTLRAQALTQQAVELMETDMERAESLLREALAADIFYGPAHNDLGVALLTKGLLYEAANEFEWARKLMPGHPDPRVNLAMTLERAGQIEEALASYRSALEANSGHLPAMQGIARLQLRHHQEDEMTRGYLQEIALRAEEPSWRTWAQAELAKRRDAR